MTKYGRADKQAKIQSKKHFDGKCAITEVSGIDGAHIYDSGVYKQFCIWLSKRETLKFNIVPVVRQIHLHRLNKDIDPEDKINYLRVSAADRNKMAAWLVSLESEVAVFKDENGGQLKWKHT